MEVLLSESGGEYVATLAGTTLSARSKSKTEAISALRDMASLALGQACTQARIDNEHRRERLP
jgi:hypothetical protein